MDRPVLGVFSLTGCGGDQLMVLNMEDELLELLGRFQIADFQEASSSKLEGPIDVALVEGTVSTEKDLEKLREIRDRSRILVALGSCAVEGCVQAMRNGEASLRERIEEVYGCQDCFPKALEPKPLHHYVKVDYSIPGCPVEKVETARALMSLLNGDLPSGYPYPVCVECKQREIPCLVLEEGRPCLGPVVRGGCEARCPALGLECIGCRGPVEKAERMEAEYQMLLDLGLSEREILNRLRMFAGEHVASLGDGGDE